MLVMRYYDRDLIRGCVKTVNLLKRKIKRVGIEEGVDRRSVRLKSVLKYFSRVIPTRNSSHSVNV
jgi:hypothetical protein